MRDRKMQILTLAGLTMMILFMLACGLAYGKGTHTERITISSGGSYTFSGSLEQTQIYVNAGDQDTVTIRLDGVFISNPSEPAVYIENAGETVLLLEDGSENIIQSGQKGSVAEESEQTEAAVYARDDLTIDGSGSLKVLGYIHNGIHTTNNLTIENGNIQVEAENVGIKGKDSVTVRGGNISVISGGDGIKSNDTTGDGYGTVTIYGGDFSVQSAGDGIYAETALRILGGEFSIVSGGGAGESESTYASVPQRDEGVSFGARKPSDPERPGQDGGRPFMGGRRDGSVPVFREGMPEQEAGDDSVSTKGLKSGSEIQISGGVIEISAADEGVEANQILIEDGSLKIHSSDDGVNASGGSTGWGFAAEWDTDMPNLNITGGTVVIDADGDGLDSNGNILIAGGTVVVNGPSDSGNGAIDSGSEIGGTAVITGGSVLAVGSSGMAATFDGDSGQCSFLCRLDSSYKAGDEIVITDEEGNILYRHEAVKSGNAVVFSSPELVLGGTYTLKAGDEQVEIELTSMSATVGTKGMINPFFRAEQW